jgi:hypothetical protein
MKAGYKPIKDVTCLFEIFLGLYCFTSLKIFMGYTNFLVSPFLALYASGFLFVGILSIVHFRRPEVIDMKLLPSRAPAVMKMLCLALSLSFVFI